MATELAAAYVTIIPSLKGAAKTIQSELSGINVASASSGWGKTVAGGLGGGLLAAGKMGASALGIIGTAVGGLALGGGISRALNIDQAEYKLEAMGLNVEKVMKSCNDAVTGTAYGLDAAATVAASLGASGVKSGDQMTDSLKAVAGMAAMSGRSMEDVGVIFGKVAAQGKLQGDELTQFAESGINATAALAKHLGVTQAEARQMVKDGIIDFQTFSDAMYATFGDAAQGANETFTGAMSNINAALSRVGAKFASPALDGLRRIFVALIPAIDAISTRLDPLVEKFTAFVESFTGGAITAIEAFTAALQDGGSVMDAFAAAFDTLSGKTKIVVAALGGLSLLSGGAFVANLAKTVTGFLGLTPAFEGVSGKLKAFGSSFGRVAGEIIKSGSPVKAFGVQLSTLGTKVSGVASRIPFLGSRLNALGSAFVFARGGTTGFLGVLKGVGIVIMSALASPIGIAIGVVAALAAAFAYLWNTNEEFKNSMVELGSQLMASIMPCLQQLGDALRQVANAVLPAIMGIIQAIVPILTTIASVIGQVVTALAPVITALVTTLVPVLTTIINIVTQVITTLVSLLVPVINMISGVIQAIMPVITQIISLVGQVVTQIVNLVVPVIMQIANIIQTVLPVIQMIFETVMGAILSVVQAVWPVIEAIITTVMNIIQSVIDIVMGIITGDWSRVWNGIKNLASSIWNGIKNIVSSAINAVKNIIQSIVNGIKNIWSNIWSWAKSFVSNMWNGIKSAVSNGVRNVIDFVKNIPSNIKNIFASAGSWLLDAGVNLIKGLWEGIVNIKDWLIDKIKGFGGMVIDWAKEALGIGSPSRYFRDEVGKWIPIGLGVGIEKYAGEAVKAVSTMNSKIVDAGMDAAELVPFNGVNSSIKTWSGVEISHNASRMEDVVGLLSAYLPEMAKEKQVVMDSGALVGAIAPGMDEALGVRSKRRSKGL